MLNAKARVLRASVLRAAITVLSVTGSVQDERDFPFSRCRTKMIASRAPRVTVIAVISKAHDNKVFLNADFV
jgi:hypothetical protein